MIGLDRVDNVSLLVEILSPVRMDRDLLSLLFFLTATPKAVVSFQELECVTACDNSSALVVQQRC
jgi:hypothetical protein